MAGWIVRRYPALLIALSLPFAAALAQDADWEACKSYEAGRSAAACSRIIATAKEPPAVLAVAHNNRAIAYLALDRRLEALADYGEAIRLDPASSKAYFNRALLQGALGRLEAERADLDAAIHLDPAYAKAYAQRGLQRLDAEPAEAVADLARALELTPALALESKPQTAPRYGEEAPPGLAKRLVAGAGALADDAAGKASAAKALQLALRLEPANAEARQALQALTEPPRPPPAPSVRPSPAAAPPKGAAIPKAQPPASPPVTTARPPVPTLPPAVPAKSAPPVAAAAPVMVLHAGRAAEGNDIARASLAAVAECEARCKATAGCGAFAFDGWNKLCFLKTAVTCVRRDPRYTTGVAATVALRQSTEATVIDRRRQRAYPDAGFRTLEAASIEVCSDACQQDDRCEGFNYKAATKACSLIERPGEYSQDAATEVGIRSQRASPSCRG